MPQAPRFLFVCTANINRSPMAAYWAELFLAERFVAGQVRSAGTHAWKGAEAGAYAIDAMRELGIDMREHRSQPVNEELLAWADQVVVMEPMHQQVLLDLAPQFGEKIRPLWLLLQAENDHVVDPQGKALDDYRRAAAEIREATKAFVTQALAERRARKPPDAP